MPISLHVNHFQASPPKKVEQESRKFLFYFVFFYLAKTNPPPRPSVYPPLASLPLPLSHLPTINCLCFSPGLCMTKPHNAYVPTASRWYTFPDSHFAGPPRCTFPSKPYAPLDTVQAPLRAERMESPVARRPPHWRIVWAECLSEYLSLSIFFCDSPVMSIRWMAALTPSSALGSLSMEISASICQIEFLFHIMCQIDGWCV